MTARICKRHIHINLHACLNVSKAISLKLFNRFQKKITTLFKYNILHRINSSTAAKKIKTGIFHKTRNSREMNVCFFAFKTGCAAKDINMYEMGHKISTGGLKKKDLLFPSSKMSVPFFISKKEILPAYRFFYFPRIYITFFASLHIQICANLIADDEDSNAN